MANTYVVVDIETTGLSAAHFAEVIEVAAFKTDGKTILEEFHSYIKPWKPIPKTASEVNHITDDMLADKPNKWAVLPKLREFIGDSVFVAHNATFDFNFLNISFFNIGIPMMNSYICTQKNYKKLFLDAKAKTNLGEACANLGITLIDAHSAYADARATVDLFIKELEIGELDKVYLTDKEVLYEVLKRIVSASPHKSQTAIMTDVPKCSAQVVLSDEDIKSQFAMGKTPNEICETSSADYEHTAWLFRHWINNVRRAKFLSLMNDKKITKEVQAMIGVCDEFEDLIELHNKIFKKAPNLSLYSIYWALDRKVSSMSYSYNDFEWHFFQQKGIMDIAKEFSLSPFLVADFFVEFAEKNRVEFHDYIADNLCKKNTLVDILNKRDFINTLSETGTPIDVKKYLTKKLYDRGFFLIDLGKGS